LADLTDHSDYSTHQNQLFLAKQLIERGANVNAVSIPQVITPLHKACYAGNVSNLDFVELLLEKDADPNVQDHIGKTPLMYTTPDAPGAAKFLLNWPTTDANIKTQSGQSFLERVRSTITIFSDQIALPDNPDRIKEKFVLQQWRGIEEMLLERGAHDTGITEIL
jgi:ankyrin repeat protein